MKCVMSGKQCAILVPTTVLAMQHYQTAVRRFEHFPVNVVMLSAFVPQKRQKEILKEIRSGKADVIISTHRIVQKDVEFRSLGLAIVDEEQRFGVAHKEKFKHMFAGVDMLTLSATPIPRTLNMAMSGIRGYVRHLPAAAGSLSGADLCHGVQRAGTGAGDSAGTETGRTGVLYPQPH